MFNKITTNHSGREKFLLKSDTVKKLKKFSSTHYTIKDFAAKPLLKHKYTRARWESMHALALIADRIPEAIGAILPQLEEMLEKDESTIVRDYATESVWKYGASSRAASARALPVLQNILAVWQDKHAARVLDGLLHIYRINPDLKNELLNIALAHKESSRGTVKKAAAKLEKEISKSAK